jgi:hypothetical protein
MTEPLNIITWRWGRKYSADYVHRLAAGVARHLAQPYKFGVFSPQAEDEYLTRVPGCFARLRMFDPEWQQQHGLTGRIVSIDLDAVVTGPLDALFDRPEPFVILHGGNASNPCPFNGSMMMLRAGAHPEIWGDFTLRHAEEAPRHEFPDDQGWLAWRLPKAAGWTVGEASGVYCFQKPGWPKGDALPAGARLVAFPGWRDPSAFTHLEWVRRHWA